MINQEIPKGLSEEAAHEAQFFNKLYAEFDDEHEKQGYLVPEYLVNQVINPKDWKLVAHEYAYSRIGDYENMSLLDYGAGDGWNTVCFAKAKAKVWAIDISENGIELIKKKAKANGVENSVIAKVQNAYKTDFSENTFDIVYGGGILHHLDIDAMGQEVSRILRPNGVAVFYEPIRETIIMDVIKSIVLHLIGRKALDVTEDEEPLTGKKIRKLESYFGSINYKYFNIISSANELIKSESFKRILLWLDYIIIKVIPGYKYLGRTVVIELREPRNKNYSH